MNSIDKVSDLQNKHILINIPDDENFIAACKSSKKMQEICSHEDVWEERLRKYYPDTVETKIRSGLSWKIFYPIASLFAKYHRLLNDYDGWVHQSHFWNENESELTQISDRIASYLANILLSHKIQNFDYRTIFDEKFTQQFKSEEDRYFINQNELNILAQRLVAKFIVAGVPKISKLINQNEFNISTDGFEILLAKFGTPEYIANNITYTNEFYRKCVQHMSQSKSLDYIKYLFEHELLEEIQEIIENSLVKGRSKVVDYLREKIEESRIRNYLTEILIEYRISPITVGYMISRNILPKFSEYIARRSEDEAVELLTTFVNANFKVPEDVIEEFGESFMYDYEELYEEIKNMID